MPSNHVENAHLENILLISFTLTHTLSSSDASPLDQTLEFCYKFQNICRDKWNKVVILLPSVVFLKKYYSDSP